MQSAINEYGTSVGFWPSATPSRDERCATMLSTTPVRGHLTAVPILCSATRTRSVHLICGVLVLIATIFSGPALAQVRSTLRGHTLALASVDYSPDGKYVATGSYDRTVKIWSVETGAEVTSSART